MDGRVYVDDEYLDEAIDLLDAAGIPCQSLGSMIAVFREDEDAAEEVLIREGIHASTW